MFYGVSHVCITVRDLARARRFYQDVIGLALKREGEGFMDLDAGTLAIRLVESPTETRTTSVRVLVRNVEEAVRVLEASGAKIVHPPHRTDGLELSAIIHDPDGNVLELWRELTEDEYGFDPDLPVNLTWRPDAEELLKGLLRHVPFLFRALARRKATREVEQLATASRVVTRENVIRGFILANARITRYRAREPLRAMGIDPDAYKEEFLAD